MDKFNVDEMDYGSYVMDDMTSVYSCFNQSRHFWNDRLTF